MLNVLADILCPVH